MLAAVQAYRGDPRPLVRATALEDAGRLLPERARDEAAGYPAAAYKLCSGSDAVTEYHALPGRGHWLVFGHGWREVADLTLSWLASRYL